MKSRNFYFFELVFLAGILFCNGSLSGQKYDVAAFVWPSYHPDDRAKIFWPDGTGEWQTVASNPPKLQGHEQPGYPLWGYINEADPYIAEMEINAAADHGVNVFIFDWYWYDGMPFLEGQLNDGYLKARNNDRVKFYLMWANHDVGLGWDMRNSNDAIKGRNKAQLWEGGVDRKEFERITLRIIEKYFKHPSYYKIDGKPVFMFYDLNNLIEGLEGIGEVRDAFEWFREQTIRAGFPGLDLQLSLRGTGNRDITDPDGKTAGTEKEVIEQLGFNSLTHYQIAHMTDVDREYGEIIQDVAAQWNTISESYDATYYPHVSMGWDASPRFTCTLYQGEPCFGIVRNNTPEKFQQGLQLAKEFLDAHPEQAPLITINSWNEWTETSYLMPDTENGYGYLEAIRNVFSSTGNLHIELGQRIWQGIPGLECTDGGRIFISWFTGGPKEPAPENTVVLSWSDDHGRTFTPPRAMALPWNDSTRCFDPTLWLDPKGRLWYIFNRGNRETAMHDVRARICNDPDATEPVFGNEFRVGYQNPYAFRMNKPTVLSTGEWIMPVTHAVEPVHDWFAGPKQIQGVGISTDEGLTWKLHGAVEAPPWALENMIVELRDGRLWMLIRTSSGVLWQSYSNDRGRTWSEGSASTVSNPGSRFFIRRTSSGNLILVNHYKFNGRSHLTAQLSSDDGVTWNDGLLLDERSGISYPDGVQDKDGLFRITYDRDRGGAGEILMATFREEDVVAGKNVSGAVSLKQVISTLERSTLLPPGWDPVQAGNEVMQHLIKVTAPQVRGAHDAEFVCAGDRAYIVAEVNDERAGENADWPSIYATMSIANLKTLKLEKVVDFAKGEQAFENDTLPAGACFVPRILQKDANTLRCYFTSEAPGKRQSQMWYRDFDLTWDKFAATIHKAKLKTSAGTFDFQPKYFHADAAAQGFTKPAVDHSFFIFDSFKRFDGKLYVALNNFSGKQNALAIVHDDLATFEVLGHFNEPQSEQLERIRGEPTARRNVDGHLPQRRGQLPLHHQRGWQSMEHRVANCLTCQTARTLSLPSTASGASITSAGRRTVASRTCTGVSSMLISQPTARNGSESTASSLRVPSSTPHSMSMTGSSG